MALKSFYFNKIHRSEYFRKFDNFMLQMLAQINHGSRAVDQP